MTEINFIALLSCLFDGTLHYHLHNTNVFNKKQCPIFKEKQKAFLIIIASHLCVIFLTQIFNKIVLDVIRCLFENIYEGGPSMLLDWYAIDVTKVVQLFLAYLSSHLVYLSSTHSTPLLLWKMFIV